MSKDIFIRTSGKWILCGEHAVLRGSPAIAFPVHSQFFEIEFIFGSKPFSVVSKSGQTLPHIEPFIKALDRGLSLLKKNRSDLNGIITTNANITLGAGLGGSATLCVTVGRLFLTLGWLSPLEMFSFCRELENVFHGKSSGLDVAVILADQGIHFEMTGDYHLLQTKWQPNWFLSYSGISSRTSDDVENVKNFVSKNPELGKEIDNMMTTSALQAEQALAMSETEGLPILVKAVDQAASCFSRWSLPPPQMRDQISKIKAGGALAVKPTGSGGGGFILSLWAPGEIPEVAGIIFYPA